MYINSTPKELAAFVKEYNLNDTLIEHLHIIYESKNKDEIDIQLAGLSKTFGFDFKNSLLCGAAQSSNAFLVAHLIEKGADVNATDECGYTPLHYVGGVRCLGQDWVEIAQLLVNAGAGVNVIGGDQKDTPLTAIMANMITFIHDSDNQESIPVLEPLLKAGADPSVKNNFGRSAQDYAKLKNARDIIELFDQYVTRHANSSISASALFQPAEQAESASSSANVPGFRSA